MIEKYRLNKAVKNFMENTTLEIGKDADITIFDEEINIKQTIAGGRTIAIPGHIKNL